MAASFEMVSMVDYRYYKGSLLEIVEKQNITDVIILSGAPSANSPDHYQRILRLLHGLPQPKSRTAPLACLWNETQPDSLLKSWTRGLN